MQKSCWVLVLSEAAGTAPSSSTLVAAAVSSAATAAPAAHATTAVVPSASPSTMSSTCSAMSQGSLLLTSTAVAAAATTSLALAATQLHTHCLLSCFYQQGGHRVKSHPVQVYRVSPYVLHNALDMGPRAHNTQVTQPMPKCKIL